MDIRIERTWKKDAYTIGKCYINNVFFSNTMEDKDRELTDTMPLSEIKQRKVYGETAIPSGTYNLQMSYSPKFSSKTWAAKYQGKVLEIPNVKGFSGVRIHPLNKASESLGCIGLGKNNVKGMITDSVNYYYEFLDEYILPAIQRGEKITLTIK